MPSGGARVNSGPPPDPDALRRDRADDRSGWTLLPAEGRQGDTPEFPLPPDVMLSSMLESTEAAREMVEAQIDSGDAPRGAHAKLAKLDQKAAQYRKALELAVGMELALWESLWRTPQAAAWERLRWTREVALYVRWQVHAELGSLDAGKEARQWSDRLGLNPTALLRNRWRINGAPDASASPAATTRSRASRPSSAKSRMKVIEGGRSA